MNAVLEPPPRAVIARGVAIALEEDLGRGDVTTTACVPRDARSEGVFAARKPLVVSGLCVVREVFAQVDPEVVLEEWVADGAAQDGTRAVVAKVRGRSRSLLMGERVALNFLQRMSGIATLARSYVGALPDGSRTRIADTRKTTPGLRAFERYAVRCGGAHNHREDLSSAVLIKDNHIAACGGVQRAIEAARSQAPHTSRVECEVDDFAKLDEALAAGADVILLDNFDDKTLAEAVKMIAGRALIEVSGNVTLERIPRIAAAGVDVISAGALTHSAPAVDIGLDFV